MRFVIFWPHWRRALGKQLDISLQTTKMTNDDDNDHNFRWTTRHVNCIWSK